MAWRIHDHVQRGELDNRERGVVRGRLWLHGLTEPVRLELRGNAAPDLAGCLLSFENSGETFALPSDAHFSLDQRGAIGDLTASRKVRVPDGPLEEFITLRKQGRPAPEHLANCLYLEWFSEANGRVVIESHAFRLTISSPAWRLTADEEQQRQRDAAAGFAGFMGKLSQALDAARHEPPEDKEWDEFDYEKFMRESDARTDKYSELLDKYLDHPDRDRIIAREMGWTALEEALEEDEQSKRSEERPSSGKSPNEADEEPFSDGEADDLEALEPNPATEGVDWVRDEDGDIKHPLASRAFESSMALWHKCKELGAEKMADEDVSALLAEYQITSAKLAGALNGLAYDRDLRDGAFIVAALKRALGHLHKSQAILEKVAPRNLLPAEMIGATRAELFAIREEILRLMEEFRGQT